MKSTAFNLNEAGKDQIKTEKIAGPTPPKRKRSKSSNVKGKFYKHFYYQIYITRKFLPLQARWYIAVQTRFTHLLISCNFVQWGSSRSFFGVQPLCGKETKALGNIAAETLFSVDVLSCFPTLANYEKCFEKH